MAINIQRRKFIGGVAARGARAAGGFDGTAGPSRIDCGRAFDASHVKRVP